MNGDEMELIAQLLLESRTCAYIEWLENKLIMAPNNNKNKDSLLVLLSTKRKPANHKAYHIPWSQEINPTRRISLASTLYTQGLLGCRYCLRRSHCVKDSSGGHRRILAYYR